MPYTIDGKSVTLDHEPQMRKGILRVPLSAVCEALGADRVTEEDAFINFPHLGVVCFFGPTSTHFRLGHLMELEAATYKRSGVMWVPVSFFSQLGFEVDVDTKHRQVSIAKPVATSAGVQPEEEAEPGRVSFVVGHRLTFGPPPPPDGGVSPAPPPGQLRPRRARLMDIIPDMGIEDE